MKDGDIHQSKMDLPYRDDASQFDDAPPPYEAAVDPEYTGPINASTRSTELGDEMAAEESPPSEFETDAEEDQAIVDQALAFVGSPPLGAVSSARLVKPVVIPQIKNGIGMPFVRAYAPELAKYDIDMQRFLEFLDNLNVIATKSPPLQMVDLAGGIVGMVPQPWFGIAGLATSVVAKTGIAVVSKTRMALFIKRANKEFLGPRGLQVEIVPSKKLKEILGFDPENHMVAPLSELNGEEIYQVSVMERRLKALDAYISPLQVHDLPEPTAQTNVLAKICAKQVERDRAKQERKMLKKRHKGISDKTDRRIAKREWKVREAEEELEKVRDKSDSRRKAKQISKVERERDKELAKLSRYKTKHANDSTHEANNAGQDSSHQPINAYEKSPQESVDETREHSGLNDNSGTHARDREKKDREVKASEKLIWIVIRNLELPTS